MPDLVYCPNCKVEFPSSSLKRRSDETAYPRASSEPPDSTCKRRWPGIEERIRQWKLETLSYRDPGISGSGTAPNGGEGESGDAVEDHDETFGEIIEIEDSGSDEPPPPTPAVKPFGERELFAKFRKLPTIKGDGLGKLIESHPEVKITNVNDIPYNVHSIVDYKWQKNAWTFKVHWEGFSDSSDTWEPETTLRPTPALHLHICEFFLSSPKVPKQRKGDAWEYFRLYVETGLLESDHPDYLVLSELANTVLKMREDCFLRPTKEEIGSMRKRVRDLLKKGDYASLFCKFDGQLDAFVKFASARAETLLNCHQWAQKIALREPKADINVENYVDCETLPSDFDYVTDYIVSEKVKVIPPRRICHCEGKECFGVNCCGTYRRNKSKTLQPGYRRKRLNQSCTFVALYECNSRCQCGPSCGNRVIQNGSELRLTIFKTCHRGWGVKANTKIRKGTFIGEYVGELMTSEEAVSRHSVDYSYLFDLRPNAENSRNTVDAAKFGNFTRFFNHSCDPNMEVSYAYIENHNPAAPRLAFFARRNIEENDELTFNYRLQTTDGSGDLTRPPCHCGAQVCKKFLF